MRLQIGLYATCMIAITLGFSLYSTPVMGGSTVLEPPAEPAAMCTQPNSGAKAVDPATTSISVTFDRPMKDKSWSWAYENKESFPETTGDPSYNADFTINTLPVKLKPNTTYVIWINTSKLTGFRSKSDVPATPYKLTFTTGPASK